MIELKYLKLIHAINTYGSLNQAAKELHLSQSTLSHQLKNLESQLGISIFLRGNSKLIFTEAGMALLNKSSDILEANASLEKLMVSYRTESASGYVHGYSNREMQRLTDQANSISDFLHYDSIWPSGSRILEVGCGVGAQSSIIAANNPDCHFTAIDISGTALDIAKQKINNLQLNNIDFKKCDAWSLTPDNFGQFDSIFICFLLEHLPNPLLLLKRLKLLIKPSGSIIIIEGDHGSTFFHPENASARAAIQAQVELQSRDGGNANIGREIFHLLQDSDYNKINVSARQIYVDGSKPMLQEGFIKNTFTAMIQGIEEKAITNKIIDKATFDSGIKALLRTAEPDGMFSYTFFKATAVA